MLRSQGCEGATPRRTRRNQCQKENKAMVRLDQYDMDEGTSQKPPQIPLQTPLKDDKYQEYNSLNIVF